jgi:hypothetical protein
MIDSFAAESARWRRATGVVAEGAPEGTPAAAPAKKKKKQKAASGMQLNLE